MRIYSWGMRFCVARDEAEARAKFETPATVKVTLTDRTEALASLCRDYLGDEPFDLRSSLREYTFRLESGEYVYGSEAAITAYGDRLKKLQEIGAKAHERYDELFEELTNERAEHGRTRDQLHSYADQLDKNKTELAEALAYGRRLTIQLEKAPKESEFNDLRTELLKTQNELKGSRALVESLKTEAAARRPAMSSPTPKLLNFETEEAQAERQAEATKAFLAGENISENPPVVVLSALAQKHGEAATRLANEGYNPDEIAAMINEGLSRNCRIAAANVKKILIEMKKAGRS